jgi:two-component system response regulator
MEQEMSSGPVNPMFRIVLVEDNEADIYLLRQAFKEAALDVELTVIEDGAEALVFARHQGKYAGIPAPDLAVLDMNLPKNSGAEVLEALRRNKHLSKVPVAVMTSSASPIEQLKAKQLGVERYITKPPDLEEFLKIGHILREVLLQGVARQQPTGSENTQDQPWKSLERIRCGCRTQRVHP